MTADIRLGDCLAILRELPPDSVDAIVTDPPYGLEFMGQDWDAPWKASGRIHEPGHLHGWDDGYGGNPYSRGRVEYGRSDMAGYQAWTTAWAIGALRVLKPGGHLAAFGGTRTYHRMVTGIEDAGFEIRDCLCWLYGSGFPKSRDVSKAIDERLGATREVLGVTRSGYHARHDERRVAYGSFAMMLQDEEGYQLNPITRPATALAREWEGWGTALKPAFEPIVLARKPLTEKSVAENVMRHGTGAVNVDGCRVGAPPRKVRQTPSRTPSSWDLRKGETWSNPNDAGRWPANLILDEDAAAQLDAEAGESVSRRQAMALPLAPGDARGQGHGDREAVTVRGHDDEGGPSRFFYTAKASRAERNAGLEGMERHLGGALNSTVAGDSRGRPEIWQVNTHPTVKPLDLMRWLVRLVTPPAGTVCDPFLGSGTTAIAAGLEHVHAIGIEREPRWHEIASARVAWWTRHGEDAVEIMRRQEQADARRAVLAESGQLALFDQPPTGSAGTE